MNKLTQVCVYIWGKFESLIEPGRFTQTVAHAYVGQGRKMNSQRKLSDMIENKEK